MNSSDTLPPLPSDGHTSPWLAYHGRLCAMYARNMARMNHYLRIASRHSVSRIRFRDHSQGWYVDTHLSDTSHDEYGHPLGYLNIVEHMNISQDLMPFDIFIGLLRHQSTKLPLSWTIGPLENPLLEGTLLSLGLTKGDDQAAMFCDLDTFRRETLSDLDLWALHNQVAMDGVCANVDWLGRRRQALCAELLEQTPLTWPHRQAVHN
ncbi:hypothetical protein GQX73_g10922 [Xylaria multiplex]|uniref:Uncharacterized protein n=1 Tax=Xylaria multiplex TaxID=323545 RepID=A0A7C8MES7_9PEZI|nr:hypothetical protein GQX73_g10922 [Xylaria multiplex]